MSTVVCYPMRRIAKIMPDRSTAPGKCRDLLALVPEFGTDGEPRRAIDPLPLARKRSRSRSAHPGWILRDSARRTPKAAWSRSDMRVYGPVTWARSPEVSSRALLTLVTQRRSGMP